MTNLSRYQAEKRQARSSLIDSLLEGARRSNMKFDKVTYLARYLAGEISKIESRRDGAPHALSVENSSLCRYTTLLKNKLYRAQLDNWFFVGSTAQDKAQLQVESGLRLELARLAVKYKRMEFRVLELQQKTKSSDGWEEDAPSSKASDTTGYLVAMALIKEFHELLSYGDGALRTKSAFASRELVPEGIFKSFLSECKARGLSIDL